MADDNEPVELWVVEVLGETRLAMKCQIDDEEVWVPKSLMLDGTDLDGEGDTGVLMVPRWFAKKERLA